MKRTASLMMLLAGTLAGGAIAFAQDNSDLAPPEQQAMTDTVQYALEENKSNQSSEWVNPDTGNSGGVTPTRTFTNDRGEPCREFISTIIIGGQQQQGYGTACRQADGSWQIVSDDSSAGQTPPPAETSVYVDSPPPRYYYYYPSDFYGPSHIYLSFGIVYRGGYVYRGRHYMNGRVFRQRHPFRVHERVFISPRDHVRFPRYQGWLNYRTAKGMRVQKYGHPQAPRDWRNRDRKKDRKHH